jgi:hypothetical protein
MKLNDTVIAQIVKLIQMALLTGTDIVDHLRMMILDQGENDNLVMNSEYQKVFDASIEKMLQNVNQQDIEGEEDIE